MFCYVSIYVVIFFYCVLFLNRFVFSFEFNYENEPMFEILHYWINWASVLECNRISTLTYRTYKGDTFLCVCSRSVNFFFDIYVLCVVICPLCVWMSSQFVRTGDCC